LKVATVASRVYREFVANICTDTASLWLGSRPRSICRRSSVLEFGGEHARCAKTTIRTQGPCYTLANAHRELARATGGARGPARGGTGARRPRRDRCCARHPSCREARPFAGRGGKITQGGTSLSRAIPIAAAYFSSKVVNDYPPVGPRRCAEFKIWGRQAMGAN
jgi:hypothetical protein